jgi:hypothetical protein
MKAAKPIGIFIAFLVGWLVWCFITTAIAGQVITDLPRPSQGESPMQSKQLCLGIVLAVQFLVPLVLVYAVSRNPRRRLSALVALALAMLGNHLVLGGIALLDKAWRRGL